MTQPGDRPDGADSKHRLAHVRPLPLLMLAAIALLATGLAAGAVIDEDVVIDSPTEWADEEYVVSANITIVDGGSLLVFDTDLVFDADEGVLVGIAVAPGGELTMRFVTATASVVPFFITSEGETTIVDSVLSGLYHSIDEGIIGLVGGVVAEAGTLRLEDVDIDAQGVGVSAFGCDLHVHDLNITGGEYGILLDEAEADLHDVSISDLIMAYVIQDSTVNITDSTIEHVNWTLWAVGSDVSVSGMESRSDGDHLAFENCTSSVVDSYFYDGQEGAVAVLGYMEVARCHFNETRTAIEQLYSEGRVVDTLVEGCADMSIVLSFVGFDSDVPDFEFDNVTVRDGAEAALDIDSVEDITIANLTVEGCGDGINVASSSVTLENVLVTGSTQCRELGCSYKATGTGILVETSEVLVHDTTVEGSNGPAVSSYWSWFNATRSSFVDGNASGILLVYSGLNLEGCEVSGNAGWGVESLGFDIDPGTLDATWGNDLADIRMNMTVNARVVDQEGKWLSHANVTASSGPLVIGPYVTGFEGRTQTYELAIHEWTDGGEDLDFNPWAFRVDYGEYESDTDVTIELGVGEITLVVEVLRPDLFIVEMDVPKETGRDQRTDISAVVGNKGNSSIESVILTFYYRDSNGFQRVIGETRVGPLEPGEEDEGGIEWVPDTRDEYIIVAFVDVDDHVDEEDDDNNREESPIRVGDGSEDAPGPGAAMALAVLVLAMLASAAARRLY